MADKVPTRFTTGRPFVDLTPFSVHVIDGNIPVLPGVSIPYVLPVAYPTAPGWFIPLLVCMILDVADQETGFDTSNPTTITNLLTWGEETFNFTLDFGGSQHAISTTIRVYSVALRPILFYASQSHTTLYLALTLILCSWPALVCLELLGVILGIALALGPLLAITPVLAILAIVDGIVGIIGNVFTFILSLICMLLKKDATCTAVYNCLCSQ